MTTGHADIYVGDALAVLRTLPDKSVQCIVTSPPYFGLRDYQADGQLGLEATPAEYVANLVAVLREARRVLRDDGVLWLNLGDSYAANRGGPNGYDDGRENRDKRTAAGVPAGLKPKDLIGIPWRVAFALQDDGWWLRSDCIWHKPSPMPESVTDRPTKAHEYVFLLSKSARYFYDAEGVAEEASQPLGEPSWTGSQAKAIITGNHSGTLGSNFGPPTRNRRTVWTIAAQPYSGAHFATMPPALAEVCIKAGTSERGRCPECGAPRERVVETIGYRSDKTPAGVKQGTVSLQPGTPGKNKNIDARNGAEPFVTHSRWREDAGIVSGWVKVKETTGWQPTCGHDAEPANCTVLDPFGGAGTTALVANRLGRDAIIIELNPEYAELARRRIVDDAPMFASVEIIAAKEAAYHE